jgi:hypothetical protein
MKHWQELESEAADAIEALQATATEYQQAADKMAWEHKVERDALRQHIKHIGNDALRSENHELRQQLAEAQAVREPIEYLLNGARVKLNFNKAGNMTSLSNMQHELQGRWVAFVAAEDGKHIAANGIGGDK